MLYSGTARSFSVVFISHLLHVVCSSPLTVHLFFVVMVPDNSSEHLSVASTLGRYSECQNPDGDWLSIQAAVKGWRLQRQSDVDYEAELADLVAAYRNARVGWQDNALKLYWAQNTVDALRSAYETRAGLTYAWVSRQRLDVALSIDLWHSLYHVTPPLGLPLPLRRPPKLRPGRTRGALPPAAPGVPHTAAPRPPGGVGGGGWRR